MTKTDQEKKSIITLRMPIDLAKQLKEEAEILGVSVNALILMRIQER